MSTDETQRILERKALVNVRALLDREEKDEAARTVGGAVAQAAKSLPVVIGAIAVCFAFFVGVSLYQRRAQALPVPTSLAEYAANVFRKAENNANRRGLGPLEGLRGRVQVSFRIRPDGYLEDLKVSRTSHDAQVDGAGLTLVKGYEPYGKFPRGAGNESLQLKGTWDFTGSRATFVPDP